MQTITKDLLRREVLKVLRTQGYVLNGNSFELRNQDRNAKREVHLLAKSERILSHKNFIIQKSKLIRKHLIDGDCIDVEKIVPRIIEVQPSSEWEDLFRWWNLVWWSLPYEHAYGRQMRFVIWDQHHKAPIGLIGLQSPILSWSVRDNYLKIPSETRDLWVNQSLSAQRLGALPPYNYILGGKLIAYLMTSDAVHRKFKEKYQGQKTVLQNRELPAHLLFVTTTGAYGKSSVYTRLKFNNDYVARFIGYSQGSGSFHIPNALFEDLIKFLDKKDIDVQRGYGTGPSRKMRLIDRALNLLGFKNGATHGVRRAVYLFPFVKNLTDVIQKNARPKWFHRSVKELTNFWRERWAKPRILRDKNYLEFKGKTFLKKVLEEVENNNVFCKGN